MLPETEFVKQRDVLEMGVSKHSLRKVLESGALKRRILPGCVYGHFLRSEVVRVFGMKEGKTSC